MLSNLYSAQIAFVLILVTASLSWAEGLSYRDAVKDALNFSARIRVKVEDVNIADATYRQNFAGLYPEISLGTRFERFENLDNRGPQTIYGQVIGGDTSAWRSNFYLWGQYYFSHWYKKRYEAFYYEKLLDTKGFECDIEVKKLLLELTDIFGSLGEGRIKLQYSSEILKRLEEILRLKKQVFAGGQAAFEEVLRVEADISATEKERAAIRKEFRENLEKLSGYTGKSYDEDTAVEALVSDGKKEVPESQRLAEETPEYKARAKELEAVRFRTKAAENNYWPDFSLYGRYDFFGSSPSGLDESLRDIRQTAYFAGILISLPLFDGGVRKWERKRSLYEIRRQEESIKAVKEEKGREIKTLEAGYTELSKSLIHYRKLSGQYGKLLDITKKAHGLGEKTLIDIMELEKDFLSVERDLKLTEQAMVAYEKRLSLAADYSHFINEHYGNGACKH